MIDGHGGNIYELAGSLGCAVDDIIDMSSNVNPLGPPPGLVERLRERIGRIACLPPVDAGGIVQLFAERYGIQAEAVLAANGTTQFIYSLPLALKAHRVLIVCPTYADYADGCRLHGIEPDLFQTVAEVDFQLDLEALEARVTAYDLVYICNPNNPTGALVMPRPLLDLCRRHPRTRFVIDESYLPFVDDAEDFSLAACDEPNVIVFNSMSKIFRIPGLRIGFMIARPAIIAQARPWMQPWCVNSLAQIAVAYLMTREAEVRSFVEKTRAYLATERVRLQQRLEGVAGLTIYPSRTSYLLLRLPPGRFAADLCAYVARDRFLIRNCANFSGLDERYFRIALKSESDNRGIAERVVRWMED